MSSKNVKEADLQGNDENLNAARDICKGSTYKSTSGISELEVSRGGWLRAEVWKLCRSSINTKATRQGKMTAVDVLVETRVQRKTFKQRNMLPNLQAAPEGGRKQCGRHSKGDTV